MSQYLNTFKDSGILDSLKSQLRYQVISKLKPEQIHTEEKKYVLKTHEDKIILSIVYEALRHYNLTYTLSVFKPECQLERDCYSREDIVAMLHLTNLLPSSVTYNEGERDQEPLLKSAFDYLSNKSSLKYADEKFCQTDFEFNSQSLNQKLSDIELNIKSKFEQQVPNYAEKLNKIQQEYDRKLKDEVERERKRFKDLEMSQLKVDLENEYRAKFEEWKENYESVYADKLAKLRAREENILAKLKDRERLVEQAAYEHRQQVLRDVEMIKAKEREVERVKSSETEKIMAELEKVQVTEKELAKRHSELERKEKEQELYINKEVQHFKREYEMEHEAMSKSIRQDHQEISREKARLAQEIHKIDDYKSDIAQLKEELREYKTRYSKLQSESDSSFKEHFQLKEQLRIVSEGAKRDYEQSVTSIQRSKSLEHENKQLKNIQENLSSTLQQVKSENSIIIQGLKSNLELKEREVNRLGEELKERYSSSRSLLDREKENSQYKLNLLENTVNDLRKDLTLTKSDYKAVYDDNRKLYDDNQNLKRLLEVYKEQNGISMEIDAYKTYDRSVPFANRAKEATLRQSTWQELHHSSSQLKNMIQDYTVNTNKDITRDDIREEHSRDDSGFTRGESVQHSDPRKYDLPGRSATLDDLGKNAEKEHILKINKYTEEQSLNNMSNTYVVTDSSERKGPTQTKKVESSDSKENLKRSNEFDEDFRFG